MAEETPESGSPNEDELREFVLREDPTLLDRLGVAEVLVQALRAAASFGFMRVGSEKRDFGQARLAIESIRALEPVLREHNVDEALVRDLEQARINLQLAYAKAVAEVSDTSQ